MSEHLHRQVTYSHNFFSKCLVEVTSVEVIEMFCLVTNLCSIIPSTNLVGGLVQTISGKINVIVMLRIYPPTPLPLTSRNEL